MSEFEQDVDQRLETLEAQENALREKCCYTSCCRVANEIRGLAKSEKRLESYVSATFTVMNQASSVIDPIQGRDAAMEMISILESEDRARSIQPDLDQAEYDNLIHWYSSCSYDNLAKATGEMHGYNSDGMHDCIADGINVCRRTGKLQCITCFREYATDVYTAADDLEMAMHYARVGIGNNDRGPHDRRFRGAQDLFNLQLLRGELQAASETVMKLVEFTEIWHSPYSAQLTANRCLRMLGSLLGEPDRWAGICAVDQPPAGEAIYDQYEEEETLAIAAICAGDYATAIELLEKWDREFLDRQSLSSWLDNRLQLIIAYKFAGQESEVARLVGPMEKKAEKARDYLTLRCLKFILDPETPLCPIPSVAAMGSGPFASEQNAAVDASPVSEKEQAIADESGDSSEAAEKSADRAGPPEALAKLMERLSAVRVEEHNAASDEDLEKASKDKDQLLTEMLALSSDSEDPNDTQYLLHCAKFLINDGSRSPEMWKWARGLIGKQRSDAVALSLFASLGASLRFGPNGEALEKVISEQQLEKMFRDSLDMDSEAAKNFGRAGDYFRFMENLGEAERCYARGFRLDRSNSDIAGSLAEIYRRTERERDALVVLDMAIREASEPDADLCWQAAILAHSNGQYDSALTYLEGYEEIVGQVAWINYYRASSFLKLNRNEEALQAAQTEADISPDSEFSSTVHMAVATARLEKPEFEQHIEKVLGTKLSSVETMSPTGIAALFELLWSVFADRAVDDPLKVRCEDCLLASGLAPDDLFVRHGDAVEGLRYFRVTVLQSLSDDWAETLGCLAAETEFKSYETSWGVLAKDEAEAGQIVGAWPQRCYSNAPHKVIETTVVDDSSYTDKPGVIWQGYRQGATE